MKRVISVALYRHANRCYGVTFGYCMLILITVIASANGASNLTFQLCVIALSFLTTWRLNFVRSSLQSLQRILQSAAVLL